MVRSMISGFVRLPAVLLFYLGMAGCIVPELHGVSVIFGLPWDFAQGGIDSLVFGRWMLIVGIPALVNGMILERGCQIEIFSRLRIKKCRNFERGLLAVCVIMGMIWGLFLAIGAAFSSGIMVALRVFPLLASNLFMWIVIQVTMHFYSQKAACAGWAALLLNGGSGLLGLYSQTIWRYMPCFWGMLCRSSFRQEQIYGQMPYMLMVILNFVVGMIGILLIENRKE